MSIIHKPHVPVDIGAHRNLPKRSIDLYVHCVDEDQKPYLRGAEGEKVGDSWDAEPTLSLPPEIAQNLMEELWDCGLRPTGTRDRDEVVAAMREHIQDLRRVAGWVPDGE